MPSAPVSVAEGGNQAATDEDTLIEVMIRAKEAALNVVGDVIIPEGEPSSPSSVVKPVQVEDVCAKELATTPKVDQQSSCLGLVGSQSGIGDSGHRMYTDEEENATTINYLKNRAADREVPFTEVVFKGNKKKGKP
ncbi:hypothetical protein A2U01_0052308, partial [Trifolium medium]|nr:hypothetical protein [Trifolium medium]